MKKIIIAIALFTFVPNISYAQETTDSYKPIGKTVDEVSEDSHDKVNSTALDRLSDGKPKEEQAEPTWDAYWSNGFEIKRSDGKFKLKFGGRIMFDWETASYDRSVEDYVGEPVNGTEFRRARFFSSGTVYDNISYKLEFDFAGGKAKLTDAWISVNDIPWIGNLQAGHFKEPFGLEELTSSKYITLMARALTSPFQPARNSGLMVYNTALNERLTWAVGTFMDVDDFGNSSGSSNARYNVTGRVTGLPYAELENNKLLHVGAAFQRRNPNDNTLSYKSEPETHQQPDFVNTKNITGVSAANVFGGEMALVMGPLSIQGEYQISHLDRSIDLTNGSSILEKQINSNFSAYYAYASFFLTKGDHRFYEPGSGTFGRMKPQKNYRERGLGAIELAFRYSSLNLIDGQDVIREGAFLGSSLISGGQVRDYTLGLNWYLTPNTRIMFNYVHSNLSNEKLGPDPEKMSQIGNAGFFRTRFQIDF